MSISKIALAAVCAISLPLAAQAERGGNGKGNNGRGGESASEARGNGQANRATRSNSGNNRNGGELHRANGNSANARANPSTGFCAPGLRKKADGCVPPGQAAAGVTAAEWAEQQGYRYVAGAELSEDEFTLLPNYADYGLPELSSSETYAVINRTAVVIDADTNTLLRVATR